MSAERQELGRAGEELAARILESRGATIVARNARPAGVRGELDLVMLDGAALAFVEVKTLRANTLAGPERPVVAVGARKQAQLRSLARAWLAEHRGSVPRHATIRFDVAGLRLDRAGRCVEWEHLRGAF